MQRIMYTDTKSTTELGPLSVDMTQIAQWRVTAQWFGHPEPFAFNCITIVVNFAGLSGGIQLGKWRLMYVLQREASDIA